MLNKKKHEKINQNVNQNENKIIMVILIRVIFVSLLVEKSFSSNSFIYDRSSKGLSLA